MKVGETYFLDTNVLLTATDESRPQHQQAQNLFTEARQSGAHLATSGQVLREYMVVATRPTAQNGLGLSMIDTLANIQSFRKHLVFCEESESVSQTLQELIQLTSIQGKKIHDANIAATMVVHGINTLFTNNISDFKVFTDIAAQPL